MDSFTNLLDSAEQDESISIIEKFLSIENTESQFRSNEELEGYSQNCDT